MLRMLGAIFLACSAGALFLAAFGQVPVRAGVALSLMCSGLAWALVPWWDKPLAPAVDEAASTDAPKPAPEDGAGAMVDATPALVGSVPMIMPEVLTPAKGKKIEIRRAYEAYEHACERAGACAVPPVEFVPLMQTLCDALDIERNDGAGTSTCST